MSYFVSVRRFPRPDQPQAVYKGALGTKLWEAPLYAGIGSAQRNASVSPEKRPGLDVRRYDWAPEFNFATPVVDATVRTWAGIFASELRSECSRDGVELNVRQYEWSPAFSWPRPVVDAIVRSWAPIFASELRSERSPDRPPLDLLRPDWTGPPAWIFKNLPAAVTTAQLWPGILENLGPSYRSGDRPGLDVRVPDWAPQFGWVQRVVDARVSTWTPVFEAALAARSPDRPVLELRRSDWAPDDGWVPTIVDRVVASWAPALRSDRSDRPLDRPLLDGRSQVLAPGWLVVTFPSGVTVAQSWPALLQALASGQRSGDRARIDVRLEWHVDIFGTPEDANPWQQLPAWLQASGVATYLVPIRTGLDLVRPDWAPSLGWIAATLASPATLAQRWPAILLALGLSYRSGDRSVLDLRPSGWAPDDGWVPQVVDTTVRSWAGIFAAELRSERAREGGRLDVRHTDWPPAFAWIFTNLPGAATIAQLWPAILLGLAPGYRSGDRARLDLRAPDGSVQPAWLQRIVEATVSRWAPVFVAELGYRSADRPSVDVRRRDLAPQDGWVPRVVDGVVRLWIPAITAEPSFRSGDRAALEVPRVSAWSTEPAGYNILAALLLSGPGPTPDVVVLVGADDIVLVVRADDMLIQVRPDDTTVRP